MKRSDDLALIRILDANINRLVEGLRVVEEVARFVLDDADLSGSLKSLRHDLARALAAVSLADRLAARDTVGDVGTGLTTPTERSRHGLRDVVVANAQRVKESLRCIEEFGKPLDARLAVAAERARYRFYEIERTLLAAFVGDRPAGAAADGKATPADVPSRKDDAPARDARRDRLAAAKLYVLLDGGPDRHGFLERARALLAAGVPVVQLRDKLLADRDLFERAVQLKRLCEQSDTLLIVNDRADVAEACDADGVHVGQDELPVAAVRRVVGGRLIGVSTHGADDLEAAFSDGADYVGLGPTFPSRTKAFEDFAGLDYLRQAVAIRDRRAPGMPMYAIGGIDAHNVPQVLSTGVDRVAVATAVTAATDVPAAVARLRDLLDRPLPGPSVPSSEPGEPVAGE